MMLRIHFHTDIISSLKSGDSPAGNGGSVDTPLSPNNFSNSTSSVVPVDRRVRDKEPEIFSKLKPGQLGPKGTSIQLVFYYINEYLLGVAVLKKHYYNLLKSLPDNYMVTMEKLCQYKILQIHGPTVNAIVSCPTFEDANKKILDFLIGCIKKDQHFLIICDVLETLVNKDMMAVVHTIRDGKMFLYLYIEMHLFIVPFKYGLFTRCPKLCP